MSYAGGAGVVMGKTSPAKRRPPNPEGHASLVDSPLPYRQEDPAEPDTRYCDTNATGIIPGYAGHRPRAQHCYGVSSYGDPNHNSHAAALRRSGELILHGDMAEWDDKLVTATGVGIDGEQSGHPDTKKDKGVWAEGMSPYAEQIGGVLPGYGGHVPRSIHKYGASAVGASPPFGTTDEETEVRQLRVLFSRQPVVRGLENGDFPRSDPNDDGEEWWPQKPPTAAIEGMMQDFRDVRNGVVPRYAGHIPRAKDKYGASALGHTRTVEGGNTFDSGNSGVNTGNQLMAQVNRFNTKSEVPFMPTQRLDGNGVVPGYRGHVPNVINAIGMSTYLSGPGFTEVKVENMEKMGGLGDLGDSAAAYGCNDWGASGFSDGAADMDNLGAADMHDKTQLSAAAQAGHVDEYTFGDASADAAAAAIAENRQKKAAFEKAKREARGF